MVDPDSFFAQKVDLGTISYNVTKKNIVYDVLRPFLAKRIIEIALSCQQLRFQMIKAMFTLYRIVKRSVAESVPDRASVHTRNAIFEAVSAPEQYCSAPLLKVEVFRIG